MTNDCPHYEDLMAEKLFGDLGLDAEVRLEAHLAACPDCRALLREMEATLQLTAARTRPEPAPVYWEGYADRLEARLHREARRPDLPRGLAAWLRAPGRLNFSVLLGPPRWAYQLSGALALVVVGVALGWLLFGQPAPDDTPVVADGPAATATVQPASLEARTDRYLDRSKVLLLGLVNLEPNAQEPALLNLDRQQQVARELIEESSALKADLQRAEKQQVLRALIEDMEVILLQIANLEAGYDLPAIEMVQRGVDRRALLLKINLTEMRRTDAALTPAVAAPQPDSSTF